MRGIGTTQAAPKRTVTANGKAALAVTGRAERRTATVNGKAVGSFRRTTDRDDER